MTTNEHDRQLPLVGLVGRPNTGKSSLFNRIAGKRISIVHGEPGVTRDRVTAPVHHDGRQCLLVDTGGLAFASDQSDEAVLHQTIREQINAVIQEAGVLIWVVDAQEGATPLDKEMAELLYPYSERVVIAANKCDNAELENHAYGDFAVFGFSEVIPVSSSHSRGIDDLLDETFARLPRRAAEEHPEAGLSVPGRLRLAVAGRPNVGKSAVINTLFGDDRVVVSDMPGTTRDAVELPLDIECEDETVPVTLVDTSGFRARKKLDTPVEHFSVRRAERSIENCDVALLVLDAMSPATAQDRRIAHIIQKHKKPCIIVGNKWDLIEDRMPGEEFCQLIDALLPFMAHCPVLPVSALTGENLEGIPEVVLDIREELNTTIPTGVLNRFLSDLVQTTPPGVHKGIGVAPKIYYATMVQNAPPTFKFFVNKKEAFSKNYLQFLRNQLRAAFFPYGGLPIELVLVGHHRAPTELSGSRAAVAGAEGEASFEKGKRAKKKRKRSGKSR